MEKRLSDKACRTAKPNEKVSYKSDGAGLRLQVLPNGRKHWQLRYFLGGKESTLQIGAYPAVSLDSARKKATGIREVVREGKHPSIERNLARARNVKRTAAKFRVVADEWLDHNRADWSGHHHERNKGLLERILYPELGNLPIADIDEPMLLRVLRKSYGRTPESARRASGVASLVWRFAKETHRATQNPARDLASSSVLKKPPVKHFAAIQQDQIGAMLRALAASGCGLVIKTALPVMLTTGLRDASLRAAQWREIDLDQGLWIVPAARMKSGREHRIPLPTQAISALRDLAKFTNVGPESFVFASHGKAGYIAENTLRMTLHNLGFKVTAHGLRSFITDLLNEQGFNADAVERQLDHVVGNKARAAYLRSDFLVQRQFMMQWLADWCEAKRDEKPGPAMPDNVVSIRSAA